MSAALDDLLLTLNPLVLRPDLLREIICRQQTQMRGDLGLLMADLFQPLRPDTDVWQLQEIGRVQAKWLAAMIGPPQRHGSLPLASAHPATGAVPPG